MNTYDEAHALAKAIRELSVRAEAVGVCAEHKIN